MVIVRKRVADFCFPTQDTKMLGKEVQNREGAVYKFTARLNLFRENKSVEVGDQLPTCTLVEHGTEGPNPRGWAFLYFG